MNNPKVKLLLLISLLAALGAVISAFAAGSHFQIGFNDGAFNFDFKVATGDSGAASVLGGIRPNRRARETSWRTRERSSSA